MATFKKFVRGNMKLDIPKNYACLHSSQGNAAGNKALVPQHCERFLLNSGRVCNTQIAELRSPDIICSKSSVCGAMRIITPLFSRQSFLANSNTKIRNIEMFATRPYRTMASRSGEKLIRCQRQKKEDSYENHILRYVMSDSQAQHPRNQRIVLRNPGDIPDVTLKTCETLREGLMPVDSDLKQRIAVRSRPKLATEKASSKDPMAGWNHPPGLELLAKHFNKNIGNSRKKGRERHLNHASRISNFSRLSVNSATVDKNSSIQRLTKLNTDRPTTNLSKVINKVVTERGAKIIRGSRDISAPPTTKPSTAVTSRGVNTGYGEEISYLGRSTANLRGGQNISQLPPARMGTAIKAAQSIGPGLRRESKSLQRSTVKPVTAVKQVASQRVVPQFAGGGTYSKIPTASTGAVPKKTTGKRNTTVERNNLGRPTTANPVIKTSMLQRVVHGIKPEKKIFERPSLNPGAELKITIQERVGPGIAGEYIGVQLKPAPRFSPRSNSNHRTIKSVLPVSKTKLEPQMAKHPKRDIQTAFKAPTAGGATQKAAAAVKINSPNAKNHGGISDAPTPIQNAAAVSPTTYQKHPQTVKAQPENKVKSRHEPLICKTSATAMWVKRFSRRNYSQNLSNISSEID